VESPHEMGQKRVCLTGLLWGQIDPSYQCALKVLTEKVSIYEIIKMDKLICRQQLINPRPFINNQGN
jgi:hypothetical protein